MTTNGLNSAIMGWIQLPMGQNYHSLQVEHDQSLLDIILAYFIKHYSTRVPIIYGWPINSQWKAKHFSLDTQPLNRLALKTPSKIESTDNGSSSTSITIGSSSTSVTIGVLYVHPSIEGCTYKTPERGKRTPRHY